MQPRVSEAPDRIVARQWAALPQLAAGQPRLVARGRFLTVDCLVGTYAEPVHLLIAEGRLEAVTPGPVLMRSWRFAVRATPEAWLAHWQPIPKPGWHDLLALAKLGVATIEGDLQPFMANLQYFKDLLALPRARAGGGAPA